MRTPPGIGPLTPNEVALWLGVHMNTVKRIPPTQLPFFRIGSRGDRRYFEQDVKSYIASRTVTE